LLHHIVTMRFLPATFIQFTLYSFAIVSRVAILPT